MQGLMIHLFVTAMVLAGFSISRYAGFDHFTVEFSIEILNLHSPVMSESSGWMDGTGGNKIISDK